MDTYIDIRLLPDPETTPNILMNALFGKLHRRLVVYGAGDIGVSFPEVSTSRRSLGTHLRLHGKDDKLRTLMSSDWLSAMRDHVNVNEPTTVPASACYRTVRRVQAKSSPERERRRLMARKGISEEAATVAIPDQCAERLDLPYILLDSRSTRQQFRLFIEHLPEQNEATTGCFSAYGLSANASIPWF